jgi:lipoate-protein ligase B
LKTFLNIPFFKMKIIDLPGLTEYSKALLLQRNLASQKSLSGHLIFVEHPPVYTAGKRLTNWANSAEAQNLRHLGAATIDTDRGGLLTFHGPGQLVAYPIMDVSKIGLRSFISGMEQVLTQTLCHIGKFIYSSFSQASRTSSRSGKRASR